MKLFFFTKLIYKYIIWLLFYYSSSYHNYMNWLWIIKLQFLNDLKPNSQWKLRKFKPFIYIFSWPYFLIPTSGSFFIPLFLIVFLYFKIFTTQRKIAKRRKQIKGEPTCRNGGKQVKIYINIGHGRVSVEKGGC